MVASQLVNYHLSHSAVFQKRSTSSAKHKHTHTHTSPSTSATWDFYREIWLLITSLKMGGRYGRGKREKRSRKTKGEGVRVLKTALSLRMENSSSHSFQHNGKTDYKRWKRRLQANKQRNKVLSSFPEANIIAALPCRCVRAARI